MLDHGECEAHAYSDVETSRRERIEQWAEVSTRKGVCLKKIIGSAAERDRSSFSTFAARAWARISCSIQNAASQAIVSRDSV
jgi:hypothetical protein